MTRKLTATVAARPEFFEGLLIGLRWSSYFWAALVIGYLCFVLR